MREPHPEGEQGAWEPAGDRPRTLWLAWPGCWVYLNKSGAWFRIVSRSFEIGDAERAMSVALDAEASMKVVISAAGSL